MRSNHPSNHPACCKSPETCTLSYVEHLQGVGLSANATPNRGVNRTSGQKDEPLAQTLIREKRWDRDMSAFKRLHDDGLTPPQVDGSALRERQAQTEYDVIERPVTVDYNDPR